MTLSAKLITGFLGFFMLIPGLVKFTDPFKTYFTTQIAKSELPFPILSYWGGQIGEIVTGLILFSLVFYGSKFAPNLARRLFYFGHLMLTAILLVALYVHFHPAVPAEVLPFEEKAPYLTVIMLVLAAVNLFIWKKNRKP